jgi:hypothetical protein
MLALTRKISPYTGADLFLGLFSTAERANEAREHYLSTVRTADPWAGQAYRSVDLDSDVRILEVANHCPQRIDLPVVHLVTARIEDMGQSVRRLLGVFATAEAAEAFARLEEEGPYETAPNWCDVDEITVNEWLAAPLPPNKSLERTRGG